MRRYEGDELNHRSLYLRILGRLWLVPAAMIVCALVFGVIYTIYITAFTGQRQYLETSKYYVHYAYNENTQAAYDNYNAYTWDDILYAHPTIRDAIEAGLPDDMTIDEAKEGTEALVLSDIRVLTIEVTTSTPERTAALSEAIRAGLTSFGEVMDEFDSIEFLSCDEPTLVVVSDRTNNAIILGAVLGGVSALLWLLIRESASDAIYAPEDLARQFAEVPVLGFTVRRKGESDEAVYGGDLLPYNMERLPKDGPIVVVSPMGADAAADAAEQFGGNYIPADLQQVPDNASGVLVVVPYGVRGAAARTELLLRQLEHERYTIYGLILTECESRFLSIYYGTRL